MSRYCVFELSEDDSIVWISDSNDFEEAEHKAAEAQKTVEERICKFCVFYQLTGETYVVSAKSHFHLEKASALA